MNAVLQEKYTAWQKYIDQEEMNIVIYLGSYNKNLIILAE